MDLIFWSENSWSYVLIYFYIRIVLSLTSNKTDFRCPFRLKKGAALGFSFFIADFIVIFVVFWILFGPAGLARSNFARSTQKTLLVLILQNFKLTCCFLNQCFPCNKKLIHVFTIFIECNENFCYLMWYIKMCLKFCSSVCFFSLPKLPRKNFRQLELNAKQGKRKNGKEISAVGGENVSKAELPWENLRLCHNFFFFRRNC